VIGKSIRGRLNNNVMAEIIKKWKDISPEDITSKPGWEEGWRLEQGNVVNVHNLRGVDKEKLTDIEKEIVSTIAEIEEKYERLRGFETLREDEEVRRTLVGIRNKLGVLLPKLRFLKLIYEKRRDSVSNGKSDDVLETTFYEEITFSPHQPPK
jgi:hypothetical protein